MQNNSTRNWELPPNGLRFFILVVLVLGVFFRFANLDCKVYWFDETFTSLRISGYYEAEVIQNLSERGEISVKDLQQYQDVNSEKGVIDTVKGLAVEEPQLTPVYFVLARFWAQIFGNSVAAIRSFSVLTSLLALPCVYWLCLELFKSSAIGWMTTALIAISPLQLVYAQEARPYSLWILTVLLSSISLLRAIRLRTRLSWSIYGVCLILGLYTHLYFSLVAMAHGIYVVVTERFRLTKTVASFLLVSAVAVVAFLPWIAIFLTNVSTAVSKAFWQAPEESSNLLLSFVKNFVGNVSRNFVDFGIDANSNKLGLILLIPAILMVIGLIGYSLYFLYEHRQKRAFAFVSLMISVPAIALTVQNLVFLKQGVIGTRYLVPLYIGIHLCVGWLLGVKLNTYYFRNWQRRVWQAIAIGVITLGVISGAIFSQSESWWHNRMNAANPQVASVINQTSHPLILAEASRFDVFNLISLSYSVKPETTLFVFKQGIPEISHRFSDVFLYRAENFSLQPQVGKKPNFKFKAAYKEVDNQSVLLWKLDRKAASDNGRDITCSFQSSSTTSTISDRSN